MVIKTHRKQDCSYGELVGGNQAGVVNMSISSATLEIRKKSESSESSNHLEAS